MNRNNTYTAITIGPIYDTISLTSSPAGLWAASFIFSYISRRLCEMIITNGLVASEDDIKSPYFSSSDKDKAPKDGIGRYHDRIVFKPKCPEAVLTPNGLPKLFDAICEEMSMNILGPDSTESSMLWFKQYFQFHAINYESVSNPILDCSAYLDALELEHSFPTNGQNPLSNLLDSNDNGRNIRIRDTICKQCSDGKWPFPTYYNEQGKERLPDMEDITGRRTEANVISVTGDKPRKVNSYYAIVQTDGDHFGDYIRSCTSPRDSSKKCLSYCSSAAKLIKEYGGVPIYAGGDDLLFIAPLTGKLKDVKANIVELLVALREQFLDEFGRNEKDPTLSLGIAIRYYKYPLYEAFGEAYKMLMSAKETRNTAAISLQKHSGQSQECVIRNFKHNSVTCKLIELMRTNSDSDDVLKSIRTKIHEFEPLFSHALLLRSENALKNVFDNVFDYKEHKQWQKQIDNVRELLGIISDSNVEESMAILDNMLRFAKFWGERGDDENDKATD